MRLDIMPTNAMTNKVKKWLIPLIFCAFAYCPAIKAAEPQSSRTSQERSLKEEFLTEDAPSPKEVEQEGKFGQLFMRMLIMLGATLILFLVGAYLSKRFLNLRGERLLKNGSIQVIERRALSNKSNLYLVDIEGERMLIAEFPNGGQVVKFMHFSDKKP